MLHSLRQSRRCTPLAVLWVVLLGSGCATTAERFLALDSLPPPAAIRAELVDRSPYGIAADEDVLALSPELREFIDARLRNYGPRERLRRLGELFARDGELALTYDQEVTRTAAGVFATRRGNCLSFTQLFIAMARELGLHSRFREQRNAGTWTRLGDVLLINRHITAWGSLQGATYEADFGDFDVSASTLSQVVSDTRARAQYFNNLGAEAVARGDPKAAMPYFNRALVLAPELAYVWTNLGTASRQLGANEAALLAFRHALRLDSNSLPALNGLARIEDERGEHAIAQALRSLATRLNARNPYLHYAAAQEAIADGDYAKAVSALQEAIRLNPREADFHFELGRAQVALGRVDRALAAFEAVERLIEDVDQERIYAMRLQAVIASLRPTTTTGAAPVAKPPSSADGSTEVPPPGPN